MLPHFHNNLSTKIIEIQDRTRMDKAVSSAPKYRGVFCTKIKSTKTPDGVAKVHFAISFNPFFDPHKDD